MCLEDFLANSQGISRTVVRMDWYTAHARCSVALQVTTYRDPFEYVGRTFRMTFAKLTWAVFEPFLVSLGFLNLGKLLAYEAAGFDALLEQKAVERSCFRCNFLVSSLMWLLYRHSQYRQGRPGQIHMKFVNGVYVVEARIVAESPKTVFLVTEKGGIFVQGPAVNKDLDVDLHVMTRHAPGDGNWWQNKQESGTSEFERPVLPDKLLEKRALLPPEKPTNWPKHRQLALRVLALDIDLVVEAASYNDTLYATSILASRNADF